MQTQTQQQPPKHLKCKHKHNNNHTTPKHKKKPHNTQKQRKKNHQNIHTTKTQTNPTRSKNTSTHTTHKHTNTHKNTNTSNNSQKHNNNNNTIWGGSVLTSEEPPVHSGELKHALSQAGGPTQSQLSRFMSSRHHISMEHRLRKKHLLLNLDTNARSGMYIEKKEEKRNTFHKKNKNEKLGK